MVQVEHAAARGRTARQEQALTALSKHTLLRRCTYRPAGSHQEALGGSQATESTHSLATQQALLLSEHTAEHKKTCDSASNGAPHAHTAPQALTRSPWAGRRRRSRGSAWTWP
eukprot:CAMPEP_0113668026 /NCGR_PEP_ID=MMETSP0038_2-20120614/3768_1 /TAXON_ID=2898 /ORGANISM="Cryptomonas paramecium" /LENGTH=112 /DNA_ID=CAMNT_0000583717 /DNA_START=140 /DNA_END=475 /DNA_ORIENTATION=+ /assembly_acc=CAM_ASM_000170